MAYIRIVYLKELVSFICYNYTRTLDQCLAVLKEKNSIIGTHKHGSQTLNHTIGQICHVHGTVEKDMVFGVNDESQILNVKLFDCDDGDLYKSLLIKRQANASYLENTDGKANQMLTNSKIIYVYGMSVGDTDNLWWDRICTWLAEDNTRHLILQKYEMPPKGVFPRRYRGLNANSVDNLWSILNLPKRKRNSLKTVFI